MSKSKFALIGLALTASLGLAACGGSSSSSGGSGSNGSSGGSSNGPEITCESISQAEAEQILGGPIEAPTPASMPSTGCSWTVANTGYSVQGITALNEQTFVFDGTQTARKTGQVDDLFTFEDVDGLGDAAYYQTNKVESTSSLIAPTLLMVKQGNRAYNISVTKKGASLDEIKAMERQAAEAILRSTSK